MPIVEMEFQTGELAALALTAETILGPESVHHKLAVGATALTREHLIRLSGERDHGSRFYEGHADAAFPEWSDSEALAIVPPVFNKKATSQRGNPLAAHFWGADILPSGTTSEATGEAIRSLAIPIGDARKQHKVPAEYDDLTMIQRAGKPPLLVETVTRKGPKGGDVVVAMRPLFILLKSVKLKGGAGVGDKSVLPTEDEYSNDAAQTLVAILNRIGGGRN